MAYETFTLKGFRTANSNVAAWIAVANKFVFGATAHSAPGHPHSRGI